MQVSFKLFNGNLKLLRNDESHLFLDLSGRRSMFPVFEGFSQGDENGRFANGTTGLWYGRGKST